MFAARVLVGCLVLVASLFALSSCGRVGIELLVDAGMDGGVVADDGGSPSDDGAVGPAPDATDDGAFTEAGFDSASTEAGPTDAASDTAVPCADEDADGVCDSLDGCPVDATKLAPGACGCNVTPPAGLLAHWALDETAGTLASELVASRNGTLRNFAPTPWVAGRHGNALSFDGSDDFVDVGGVTSSLRAIAFWVRPADLEAVSSNTGWLSPTANGNPNNGWMDASNVYVSDDNYANAGLLNDINNDFHGFGIRLPASASVLGVEVEVEMKTGNPTGTFAIELSWNRGDDYTNTNRQAPLTTSDQYWPFGGMTDLWGHSWRPAELDNASFRVGLSKQGINFSPMTPGIDHLRVRVHHTAALFNRVLFDLGGGPRVELSASGIVLTGFPSGSAIYTDGALGAALDLSWHHVVITTLSDVAVPAFAMGGAPGHSHTFRGLIDDVKLFTEVPTASDRTTLSLSPSCR